jgi:ribokinase
VFLVLLDGLVETQMKKILVIGSSNIDYVVSMNRLPKTGETVMGNGVEIFSGGKGANQAVACGLLGGRTGFLTVLGNTVNTNLLEEMFTKAEISIDGIDRKDDHVTGMAYINVDSKGQNTIIVVPGANTQCTKEYLLSRDDFFKEADIILIQLEIPLDAVAYAIGRAKELGKIIVLNPAPMPEGEELFFIDQIDYLTPNETELGILTGMPIDSLDNITRGAEALVARGVKHVIVTLGKQGALLVNAHHQKLYAPPEIKVVDTTAAGDTFNGALVVGLAEGMSLDDSIYFANVAASLTVSRKGAQAAMPMRDEVEKFLNSLQE